MIVVSTMKRKKKYNSLKERYPPSEPCSCEICRSYCIPPGWWTVEEATRAIKAGYGKRMMLEISPEMTFGVISPAFKGCEGNYDLQECPANIEKEWRTPAGQNLVKSWIDQRIKESAYNG